MTLPVRLVSHRGKMDAAALLDASVDVVGAVAAAEARGVGFFAQTDRPVLPFEGHVFHRETAGRHSAKHPTISHEGRTRANRRAGRREYDRPAQATALCDDDPAPALRRCPWGTFQFIGFNHATSGFEDVGSFVDAMATGERERIPAFRRFALAHDEMAERPRARHWAAFARRCNGPRLRKNACDAKRAAAFAEAQVAAPDADAGVDQRNLMMQLQARLNAATGMGPSPDGWIGPKTRTAIAAFRTAEGLPSTGDPDPATVAALRIEGDFAFAMRGGKDRAKCPADDPSRRHRHRGRVRPAPGHAARWRAQERRAFRPVLVFRRVAGRDRRDARLGRGREEPDLARRGGVGLGGLASVTEIEIFASIGVPTNP